jgi:hypothetical protein
MVEDYESLPISDNQSHNNLDEQIKIRQDQINKKKNEIIYSLSKQLASTSSAQDTTSTSANSPKNMFKTTRYVPINVTQHQPPSIKTHRPPTAPSTKKQINAIRKNARVEIKNIITTSLSNTSSQMQETQAQQHIPSTNKKTLKRQRRQARNKHTSTGEPQSPAAIVQPQPQAIYHNAVAHIYNYGNQNKQTSTATSLSSPETQPTTNQITVPSTANKRTRRHKRNRANRTLRAQEDPMVS